MNIQENVPLAPFTTFRIGGVARFFVQVRSVADVEEAAAFAKGKKVFILGGGSNLLISDSGFDGLVIKNEIMGVDEESVTASDGRIYTRIISGAGESWDSLVEYTVVKKGLYGLENLSLIPGTVGATPVQNIGAYGAEAKDTIEWVEVYNPATKQIERLSNADCKFAYRDSIFKHERKGNIILRVAFLLAKNGQLNTEYKDLKNYFATKITPPSLCDVRDAVIKIRTDKLPDISKIGTAGSFFKNAMVTREQYQELLKKYPNMPVFSLSASNSGGNEMVKVPVAWILDNVCGFKGVKRGQVGVYQNQALVLVNFGGGTAQQIKDLANEMIASVKEKTGIDISPEVEYV